MVDKVVDKGVDTRKLFSVSSPVYASGKVELMVFRN